MVTCGAVLRIAALLVLPASWAAANPASNVPSAADPDNAIDLHVTLDYAYQVDRSSIHREATGSDPLGGTPQRPDLEFTQSSHLLTPRADLAIYHDTWLSFALPVVIAQARRLDLAAGVDRARSSTIRDGLVPFEGYDANDPGTPLPGDGVFRGRNRSGLTQVHLGLGVAPMNQARDPTKPTWKLGGEVRLAVGKIMRFDPMRPEAETGVNKGVHELRLWTSFARRFARTEGWFELFWQVPLRATDESLFTNPGFGATNVGLGQQAGAAFGIETFVVDDRANKNRVSVDLGAKIIGHFEGRDYTEMWEVFALAGDSRLGGPLVLDADPVVPGVQALSHPGISNFENHLETRASLAVRAALGTTVQFAATLDIAWKTDHAISFADAGIDLPTCRPGLTRRCEDADNDLVNPGTAEVNPLHVPRIDLVGHRYLSVDNLSVIVGVQGIVLF
jgi:hypothetical protein